MWKSGAHTVAEAKSYGIKAITVGIEGIDELFATLDLMPELAAEAARNGIAQSAVAVAARAKASTADGLIAQAIDTETTRNGAEVRASVFVSPAGHKTPLWPVFVEMGTGPKGIASGGEKYPLTVTGPLHAPVEAFWAHLPNGKAVVEMAAPAAPI